MFNLDRPEDRFAVLSALHARIQDAFSEFGVQIMSPHFETQPRKAGLRPEGRLVRRPGVKRAPGYRVVFDG